MALESRGFVVTKDLRTDRRVKLSVPKAGKLRFGIVSDTHLGHVKQQLTYWREFTARAERFGAEFMLHAGDLVDGQNMHRDQQWELHRHGAHAQALYAAEMVPKLHGRSSKAVLPTYVIGGNHDGSAWMSAGANTLDTLTSRRPDITFLGAPLATFEASGLRIMLMHPDGGVAYSRSYKPQKICEQFAPDEKPHVLLLGHWHITDYLPAYRGIHALSLPCFQAQTAYLKRKGLAPVVGGVLVEVEYDAHGIRAFTPSFHIWNTHLQNDY